MFERAVQKRDMILVIIGWRTRVKAGYPCVRTVLRERRIRFHRAQLNTLLTKANAKARMKAVEK